MKAVLIALLMSNAPWAPPSLPPDTGELAQSWSCTPRRLCTQITTCEEARWYMAQCTWGYRLDGDSDGIPCEKLCGSSP